MTILPAHTPATTSDTCTIIIATLGLAERSASLERAIRSLQTGNTTPVDILVVVNGNRFDPAVVEGLRRRTDIRLIQIETGSLSAAILAGRRHVTSPFFGFLDDDDEYLPGAVDARLAVMRERPDASFVVTNGFRHANGKDEIIVRGMATVEQDPLSALFRENWLASCGGLYRTRDLPAEFFEDIARYLEWTWLAFRLSSASRRVAVLDQPTFRVHDTVGSESKSDAYRFSRVETLRRMLAETADRDIREVLRSRIAQSLNDISCEHLRRGRYLEAWRAHLQCLGQPSGLRYVPYTRHLLLPGRR